MLGRPTLAVLPSMVDVGADGVVHKRYGLRNGATAQRRNGATAQRRNGATAQRRNALGACPIAFLNIAVKALSLV